MSSKHTTTTAQRRPPTSTAIGGAIGLLVVSILTATAGNSGIFTIGLVLGMGIVGGMALLRKTHYGLSLLGTATVVTVLPSTVLLAGHRLMFVDVFVGTTIIAGVLVGVGLPQLRWTIIDGRTTADAIGRVAGVCVALGLLAGGILVLQGTLSDLLRLNQFWRPIQRIITVFVVPPRPEIAMIGMIGLGGYAVFGLLAWLSAAPIVALTPQPRKERVKNLVATIRRSIVIGVGGGSVVVGLLYPMVQAGVVSVPGRIGTLIEVLATAPVIRRLLLGAGTVGYLIALVLVSIKIGTQRDNRETVGWVGEIIGSTGLVAGGIVLWDERLFAELTARAPEQVAVLSRNLAAVIGESMTIVLLALLLLAAAVGVLVGLMIGLRLGFLRVRTVGARAMMIGIVLLVTGGAVAGMDAVPLFVGMVGVVVVWDLSEFGTGLSEELGVDTPTRQPELVHAIGSLVVGGLLVGGVLLVQRLVRDTQFDPTLSLPALGIALGTALVLTVLLRG